MRALEVVILMVCIAISIPLVAVMMPLHNDGGGVDIGTHNLSATKAFDWSTLDSYKLKSDPSIYDQASYYIQMGILAITGVATILFSGITLAPELLGIFAVNPVLIGVLLSAFAVILILAWLQIAKGDDWSGKR